MKQLPTDTVRLLSSAQVMKQLPTDTVRLLSSAQVITCVLNVVKELLENSLDAGASSIEIKLENYGLDQIEVKDNGTGIQAADTPVMAVKHYTSKIFSHDDLEHLETYGFRGEALGSICAVAEVTVTTKTAEDDVSTRYVLDATGRVTTQRPSHLGKGTTVSVLKLFKNLPVRRQYYANVKKCKEELKKVQDLLVAYAIVKPELRLTLAHNKVVVWQKAKVSDHKMALLATLGASTVANLTPRHHRQEQPEILIDGFFPKPGTDYGSTSSSSPDKTFIFVNERPVQQKDILKSVRQHYMAQYPGDSTCRRYPILMLNITVPASTVDVNLRPDKTQVLLHNMEAVLTAVETLLVSLYGSGSFAEAQQVSRAEDSVSLTPSSPRHAGSSVPDSWTRSDVEDTLRDAGVPKAPPDGDDSAIPNIQDAETLLNHQPLNSNSSSSSADDWIVNHIPVDFDLNFLDHDTAPTCTDITDPGPVTLHKRLTNNSDQDQNRGEYMNQLSEESWSRGTALMSPSTGEPLQPVKLHVPTGSGHGGIVEVKGQRSPDKKVSNAITDKQASLRAYDLISNRIMRTPLSPAALFERETRGDVLKEKPQASLKDISAAVQERWKNLGEEDRKKYEEKSKKDSERYDRRTKLNSDGEEPERSGFPLCRPQGQKRKALLPNQQVLDQLFSPQPQKKKSPGPKPSQPLPFSLTALRLKLQRLSSQSDPRPRGLRLVNCLASQSAWVILCGRKLMLINPFRVEEALLLKRLLEDNILPTVSLHSPIQLTDSILGGAECTQALYAMEMGSPELSGTSLFTDSRLLANGFKIQCNPERHLEVTAMANCMPFFGVEDLREILTAVLHSNAKTVGECRPLKVSNYFQGEAVRLARQLPSTLTKDDVENTLSRMQKQLGETSQSCIHGHSFLHYLCDVPDTEEEAKAIVMSSPV